MENGRKEQEQKPGEQRAEDIAYTINHAIACTASDLASPFIGNWTERYLGKRLSPGCGHDHEHGAACDHNHAAKSHLDKYFIGEVVGDFAAVPITISLQRHLPALNNALGRGLESMLGPLFRRSSRRTARHWAEANGIAAGAPEAKAREGEIYNYEIRHLPQALIWSATSTVLNIATQKTLSAMGGEARPLWHIITGKTVGTAFSALVVVGGRAFFPGAAHRWDSATAKHVFLPATRAVSGLFGIDAGAVARMEQEREWAEGISWQKRMGERGETEARGRQAP